MIHCYTIFGSVQTPRGSCLAFHFGFVFRSIVENLLTGDTVLLVLLITKLPMLSLYLSPLKSSFWQPYVAPKALSPAWEIPENSHRSGLDFLQHWLCSFVADLQRIPLDYHRAYRDSVLDSSGYGFGVLWDPSTPIEDAVYHKSSSVRRLFDPDIRHDNHSQSCRCRDFLCRGPIVLRLWAWSGDKKHLACSRRSLWKTCQSVKLLVVT